MFTSLQRPVSATTCQIKLMPSMANETSGLSDAWCSHRVKVDGQFLRDVELSMRRCPPYYHLYSKMHCGRIYLGEHNVSF